MIRPITIALSIVTSLAIAACAPGGEQAPAADAPAEGAGAAGPTATAIFTPTVVARVPVTPTPDPLSAVAAEDLPDVVVPAGASRTEFSPADDTADAHAGYTMPAMDTEALTAWFRAEMAKAGWTEDEERDGALIFLHSEQLSERYAGEGLKRTCTVFFDTGTAPEGGTTFSVVAEAPAAAAGNR